MPEYFIILLIIIVVARLLQIRFKVKLYKTLKHLLVYNSFNLILASLWDQFAIYRGHWSFNEKFLLGPKIGFMPIEEFLFVIVVSYFALVLYRVVEKKI